MLITCLNPSAGMSECDVLEPPRSFSERVIPWEAGKIPSQGGHFEGSFETHRLCYRAKTAAHASQPSVLGAGMVRRSLAFSPLCPSVVCCTGFEPFREGGWGWGYSSPSLHTPLSASATRYSSFLHSNNCSNLVIKDFRK